MDENKKFDVLLHFTNIRAAIEILYGGKLRSGQFANSDDPLERWEEYEARRVDLNFKPVEGDPLAFGEDESLDQISYLSFSRAVAIEIFNQTLRIDTLILPRMWAQYGDSHKGVCLIFEKDGFVKKVESTDSPVKHQLINYQKTIEPKYASQGKIKDEFISERLVKHADWENQREYRFIFPKNEKVYIDIDKVLIGIVYRNVSEIAEHQKWIRKFAQSKELYFSNLKVEHGGWQVPDLVRLKVDE